MSLLPERIVTSQCHVVFVHSLDLYMHFGALDPQPLYPTNLVVCVIFLVVGWEH